VITAALESYRESREVERADTTISRVHDTEDPFHHTAEGESSTVNTETTVSKVNATQTSVIEGIANPGGAGDALKSEEKQNGIRADLSDAASSLLVSPTLVIPETPCSVEPGMGDLSIKLGEEISKVVDSPRSELKIRLEQADGDVEADSVAPMKNDFQLRKLNGEGRQLTASSPDEMDSHQGNYTEVVKVAVAVNEEPESDAANEEYDFLLCYYCKEKLQSPCWYCIDCSERIVLICMECDPVGGFDKGAHKKDHFLLSVRAETTKDESSEIDNKILSSILNLESRVNTRLSNLESTIDGRIRSLKEEFTGRSNELEGPTHERNIAMDERLTRIEQLLEKLFSERFIGS